MPDPQQEQPIPKWMIGLLELIEIDLTAGKMPAKARVALALQRVHAGLRKAKGA